MGPMENFKKMVSRSLVMGYTLGLLSLAMGHAQMYVDRQGVVVFEASEQLFEPVKAKNGAVSVLFDASDQTLASLALMRGFEFENALMQEHFNENYIESDRYPKAMFTGKILDFDPAMAGGGPREDTIMGRLEIRGVAREIQPRVLIRKNAEILSLHGSFKLRPQDFNIEIPGIVANKIAKEVLVTLDFKLKEDERP